MKQIIIRKGNIEVDEVPAPLVEPGTVLVQVDHSCISIGTELSGIKSSGEPLWKRAFKQPENVKKAFQLLANTGFSHTKSVITGQLAAGTATGYSAAGKVIAVGQGVTQYQIGDRVACAGAQCAHHAQIIRVPHALTAKIPDNVPFTEASTVTLGAIALQGIRRAAPTLGEVFVVMGLGILGQLTVQLLRANGCQVIGIDLDPHRIALANQMGMEAGFTSDAAFISSVLQLTQGQGADGIIITAATPSNEVVANAFQACRKKGRVVLVGDVGLQLNRNDFYVKEIDFLISCSYGPGRYDSHYEEEGLDYPIGYVRWTENRNMKEYLRLLSTGQVTLTPLIHSIHTVEHAAIAYGTLREEPRPLMVLLHYTGNQLTNPSPTTIHLRSPMTKSDALQIALIGAGGFAKTVHLPNLQKLSKEFHVRAIVSHTGHNATATARQFSADYATTDYRQVLDDPSIDAVIITTRHHLHGSMALEALQKGKHVLVEKPLALESEELDRIQTYYAQAQNPPLLLTGFNRRFSPFIQRIHELTAQRRNPMMISYRMNAGHIALDHWVHGLEGGGRNRGEACHIYDLFTFLTGSHVKKVQVSVIAPITEYYSSQDNFSVTLSFSDGSVANLIYTALGHSDYPKEQMEIFCDSNVFSLNNYQQLQGTQIKNEKTTLPNKGHREELIAFATAIKTGGGWPIPLWQQVQATEIALAVEHQLTLGSSCVEL